jgi:hypothetical protein
MLPFRRSAPPENALCLLRIHKTGSQSFRQYYSKAFRRKPPPNSNFGYKITPDMAEGSRFLAPHMSLASWQAVAPATGHVVAVTLRHPVARLRSAHRYFALKSRDHVTGVGAMLADLDYEAFLADERDDIRALKDNILTRFIGGGQFRPGPEGRNKLDLPTDRSFESAVAKVGAQADAGRFHPLVLELADTSIARLNNVLGYAGKVALPHINKSKSRRPVPEAPAPSPQEEPWVRHDLAVYEMMHDLVETDAVKTA